MLFHSCFQNSAYLSQSEWVSWYSIIYYKAHFGVSIALYSKSEVRSIYYSRSIPKLHSYIGGERLHLCQQLHANKNTRSKVDQRLWTWTFWMFKSHDILYFRLFTTVNVVIGTRLLDEPNSDLIWSHWTIQVALYFNLRRFFLRVLHFNENSFTFRHGLILY